jgi:hypothetical protein
MEKITEKEKMIATMNKLAKSLKKFHDLTQG